MIVGAGVLSKLRKLAALFGLVSIAFSFSDVGGTLTEGVISAIGPLGDGTALGASCNLLMPPDCDPNKAPSAFLAGFGLVVVCGPSTFAFSSRERCSSTRAAAPVSNLGVNFGESADLGALDTGTSAGLEGLESGATTAGSGAAGENGLGERRRLRVPCVLLRLAASVMGMFANVSDEVGVWGRVAGAQGGGALVMDSAIKGVAVVCYEGNCSASMANFIFARSPSSALGK